MRFGGYFASGLLWLTLFAVHAGRNLFFFATVIDRYIAAEAKMPPTSVWSEKEVSQQLMSLAIVEVC
jgi:hypothetical protein